MNVFLQSLHFFCIFLEPELSTKEKKIYIYNMSLTIITRETLSLCIFFIYPFFLKHQKLLIGIFG